MLRPPTPSGARAAIRACLPPPVGARTAPSKREPREVARRGGLCRFAPLHWRMRRTGPCPSDRSTRTLVLELWPPHLFLAPWLVRGSSAVRAPRRSAAAPRGFASRRLGRARLLSVACKDDVEARRGDERVGAGETRSRTGPSRRRGCRPTPCALSSSPSLRRAATSRGVSISLIWRSLSVGWRPAMATRRISPSPPPLLETCPSSDSFLSLPLPLPPHPVAPPLLSFSPPSVCPLACTHARVSERRAYAFLLLPILRTLRPGPLRSLSCRPDLFFPQPSRLPSSAREQAHPNSHLPTRLPVSPASHLASSHTPRSTHSAKSTAPLHFLHLAGTLVLPLPRQNSAPSSTPPSLLLLIASPDTLTTSLHRARSPFFVA